MDCDLVQQLILEAFAEPPSHEEQQRIAAHLTGCPGCRAFDARHRALDERLAASLPPLMATGSVRAGVMARLAHDQRLHWNAGLPDGLHFATCGVSTAVCLALLPLDHVTILIGGVTTTLAGYVLLTTARLVLDGHDA